MFIKKKTQTNQILGFQSAKKIFKLIVLIFNTEEKKRGTDLEFIDPFSLSGIKRKDIKNNFNRGFSVNRSVYGFIIIGPNKSAVGFSESLTIYCVELIKKIDWIDDYFRPISHVVNEGFHKIDSFV